MIWEIDKCLWKKILNNEKTSLFLLKVMMEKIERQEFLIKELTTRGTEEQSSGVLKRENSKCHQLLFQFTDFFQMKPKTCSLPYSLFFRNTLVEQKTKLKIVN